MIESVIKWSESKRSQAATIKPFLPETYGTYYEPFIGGGSMLYALSSEKSMCGDIYEPLIDLWKEIRDNPTALAERVSCSLDNTPRRGLYGILRD